MTTTTVSELRPYSASPSFSTEVPEATRAPRVAPTEVPKSTPISAIKHTADIRDLVTDADRLTTSLSSLSSDIRKSHAKALEEELNTRVQQKVKESPLTMLETLGNMGFSWRAVAQLLGVSVPALQKWRRGDGISGENRRKIATLLAGINVIASQYKVQEIDSWFETPIADETPVTPITIWSAGEYILALRYASDELTSEATLDAFDPDWRAKWTSRFEAVRAEDGHISLVMKEQ